MNFLSIIPNKLRFHLGYLYTGSVGEGFPPYMNKSGFLVYMISNHPFYRVLPYLHRLVSIICLGLSPEDVISFGVCTNLNKTSPDFNVGGGTMEGASIGMLVSDFRSMSPEKFSGLILDLLNKEGIFVSSDSSCKPFCTSGCRSFFVHLKKASIS